MSARRAGLSALALVVLLAQTASAQRPLGWRTDGTGNYPQAHPPVEWSLTHNVLWSTPMPSWSNSSPVLVGDRILMSSEPDTVVCLRAGDGKILWQRPNPVEDAVAKLSHPPPFLQAGAQTRQLETSLQQQEYDLTGLRRLLGKSANDATLSGRAHALEERSADLRQRLGSLAPLMRPDVNTENGFSSPTPASDGDSVYVLYATGVAASYDLDGKRRWIQFVDQPLARDGVSASPVLAGDKLLVLVNDLFALDTATGEIRWRTSVALRQGTPIVFQIEDQDFALLPSGDCVRVADGAVVASGIGDLEYASPVIRDHRLYMVQQKAQAFRVPEKLDALDFKELWATHMKGARYYSSPLILDGLIYAVSRNDILSVLDAETGDPVYVQRLDLGSMGGVNSVYASPTEGGPYVFVSGVGGTTVVLKPGRQFEQVASNELEKVRATPVFDGDRIYIRGHKNFYCISSEAGGATSPTAR